MLETELKLEKTWPMPDKKDCLWYHTMRFPDGEVAEGVWEIEDFEGYIGGYDIKGKDVLDVGAASGYISFQAERAGARVTALDAYNSDEFRHVPFTTSNSFIDLQKSRYDWNTHSLIPMKNSWWYSWHKFDSEAECAYVPHSTLYLTNRRFDVVIAGAIIEHLSDPVFSIGSWARVAKEAIIIPFTEVNNSEELLMTPITPWDDPNMFYSWWTLSAGLYKRILANLGFDFNVVMATAQFNGNTGSRPTIIARRR